MKGVCDWLIPYTYIVNDWFKPLKWNLEKKWWGRIPGAHNPSLFSCWFGLCYNKQFPDPSTSVFLNFTLVHLETNFLSSNTILSFILDNKMSSVSLTDVLHHSFSHIKLDIVMGIALFSSCLLELNVACACQHMLYTVPVLTFLDA